jgi:hypothetical protein
LTLCSINPPLLFVLKKILNPSQMISVEQNSESNDQDDDSGSAVSARRGPLVLSQHLTSGPGMIDNQHSSSSTLSGCGATTRQPANNKKNGHGNIVHG